jgi:predicted O-methyltransferase YrrM
MIDLSSQNEWQFKDPETGLIFPWYTKPALDEIVTWDLKDKVVFEYGCGASTLWWREKAKAVYSVDEDREYAEATGSYLAKNPVDFLHYIYEFPPLDIVIIDGERLRQEAVEHALKCLKPGGALIYDNWMQPSVEMQSEETQRLLLALPHTIYKQPGHPDWQTLIATKLREITNMKLTEVSLLQNGEYGISFSTH